MIQRIILVAAIKNALKLKKFESLEVTIKEEEGKKWIYIVIDQFDKKRRQLEEKEEEQLRKEFGMDPVGLELTISKKKINVSFIKDGKREKFEF